MCLLKIHLFKTLKKKYKNVILVSLSLFIELLLVISHFLLNIHSHLTKVDSFKKKWKMNKKETRRGTLETQKEFF